MKSIIQSLNKNIAPVPVMKNQEGMVLAISMVLMLVITVMGVLALSTSSTDVMVAGNQRLREINMSIASSGKAVSRPIIEDIAKDGKLNNGGFKSVIEDSAGLENEIRTGSFINMFLVPTSVNPNPKEAIKEAIKFPDLRILPENLLVDIDFVAKGQGEGLAEFGGAEKSGTTNVFFYYRINSIARGDVGSEAVAASIYRHVKKLQ